MWKQDFEWIGDSEEEIINELQWWNCQSSDCDVTVFHYLEGSRADLKSRMGVLRSGTYLFTIDDFYDNRKLTLGYAQDSDSKCFHVFLLDCGWVAAYPNDKILWYNPNFVDKRLDVPKYKAYQQNLRAENI